MITYLVRRFFYAIAVIFVISLIAFFLVEIVPGDPVRAMLGTKAPQELVDAMRKELWFDRPILIQYGHFLGNILKGDFGKSVMYQEDVGRLWAARLPITMHISLLSIIVSTIVGIIVGTISAIRRGSVLDQTISVLSNLGVSIPTFWLGILGIYLFGLNLGWLPIQGYTSPFKDFLLSSRQLIMPVICLAIPGIAMMARQTRSSMLEVIKQEYIRTAWAKGLKEQAVIFRHVLKNSLIPIVTLLGVMFPVIVAGAVLIEMVFNIPGMGRLMVRAVLNKDFILVQSGVFLTAIVVSLANLVVDISYGWLDPRIRYE